MDRINHSNSNSIGSLGPNKSNNSNASISSNVGVMSMSMSNGNGVMMMNNSSNNGMAMSMAMPMEAPPPQSRERDNGNGSGNNPNGHGPGTGTGPMLDNGGAPSNTILGLTLLMEQPVIEEDDDDDEHDQRANGTTTHWEYHNVNLQRIPGYGFGIAVSGGRDNPHFANGDPSIAISDVLKGGPAEGKLSVNDRILSANGVNLENVDYATAVQVLRDNSNVQLVIKRRTIHHHQSNVFKVSVSKGQKKDFAIPLCTQLVIKEARATLQPGDIILKINSTSAENLSAKEAKRLIESKDKLELVIQRNSNVNQTSASTVNQNLYVQQPRRADVQTGSVPHLIPPPPPRPSPPPPRPPPPVEDAMDGNAGAMTPYGLANTQQNSQTRVIKFKKVQSLGIRLAGGNTSGIFVSAVQPNSPASIQNLQPGDKILSVNGQDLSLFTREEAVQLLLNTHDDVELVVDSKGGVVGGDCFYIKTACDHATALKGELSFKKGEIFCVLDSLYGGTIGNWQVERMSTGEKGIIPNKSRFEETVSKSNSGLNTSFFKKKSPPIVYERVVFDRVPYTRPVVLLGVGASIAKNRLMKEYPKEFQALDSPTTTLSYTRVRVSAIRNIINSNRHCIMSNISSPIDKLDQLYPIVVLLKTDDKGIIKELGGGSSTLNGKNNWKKLEKNWGTSIHAVLEIIDSNWCSELKEMIDQEQSKCTWIREEDFKQQPTNQNPTEPDYLILNHDSSYISANELSSAMASSQATANNTNSNDAKISLPDYNAPPPYALGGSNNSIDNKIEIAKLSTVTPDKYQKPNYNFVPALEPNSSSYSLGRNKILAHTPPPIPPPESRHMKSVEKPPAVDRTKKPERRQFDDPYAVFSDKLSYIHQNGGSPYSYTKSLPNHNHYNSNNTITTDLNGNPLSSAISLSPSPLLVPTIDQSYHSLTAGANNASNTWKQQRGGNGMMNSSNNNHMYDNHNASSTPTNFYQENNRITTNGNGNPYKMDNHRTNNRESSVASPNNVYLTPPRPKMKPVPPPKPLKAIDLYSNTYLNVPTRRESAFQVYNGNNSNNHRNSGSKSTSSSSNHHSSSNHNSHHNSSQNNRKYVMLGHEEDLIRSPSSQAPLPPPPNIQAVKKRIGTSGGSLGLQGVLLEVPKGALECRTEISMEIIEPLQSKGTFQSPIVALQPEGLTFQKPVKLSLPHWMNSDVTSYLKITNNDFVNATEDNHYIHVLLNSI